jgi:hypothetical protein
MTATPAGKGATVYTVDGVPVAWVRELPSGQVTGGGKAKHLMAALELLLKSKGETT